MSKILLNLVMLFSGIWKALGADVVQLRAILDAKLKIDNRRPVTFGANKGVESKKKKERKNTIAVTMLLSFFTGLIYIFPILLTKMDITIGLTLFYTLFMFFFTFTLITDFANILIDTKDKFILFSRPVSDRTITLSRLLYISIYLFRMVIPMSLPAWIIFGILHGWIAVLWFPLALVLNVFIVLFLVCALYILMIKIAGAGKFKDVLNYFQIIFSIVFFATWMFASRMINPEAVKELKLEAYDWVKFLPSYWTAATWSWINGSAKLLPQTGWTGILAIIFPFISLWITIKWLAPQFIKSLVLSDNLPEPAQKKNGKTKTAKQQSTYLSLARMLNKSDTAKAGFIMTWLQTARSRTFKMRVYPSLAYVPVYFFFILLGSSRPFSEVWAALPESKESYIILLYMTTFVVMQALNYITMSDQYKAAWIYYSTPVDKPGHVITGALKAMWVKYFLPFMVVIGVFVIYIWGPGTILDVILATINITLFIVLMMRYNYRILPFSVKEQVKDNGIKTALRLILILTLIGGLGVCHYLASLMWWLKIVFTALAAIALWLLYDSLQNLPWSKLKNGED